MAGSEEHQLLGGALLRRDGLNAEEQPGAGGRGLLIIEHVGTLRRRAGGIHRETHFGALPEQLGQTPVPVGDGRVGPDQYAGHGAASLGRVAPGLQHDVISTRPSSE